MRTISINFHRDFSGVQQKPKTTRRVEKQSLSGKQNNTAEKTDLYDKNSREENPDWQCRQRPEALLIPFDAPHLQSKHSPFRSPDYVIENAHGSQRVSSCFRFSSKTSPPSLSLKKNSRLSVSQLLSLGSENIGKYAINRLSWLPCLSKHSSLWI